LIQKIFILLENKNLLDRARSTVVQKAPIPDVVRPLGSESTGQDKRICFLAQPDAFRLPASAARGLRLTGKLMDQLNKGGSR